MIDCGCDYTCQQRASICPRGTSHASNLQKMVDPYDAGRRLRERMGIGVTAEEMADYLADALEKSLRFEREGQLGIAVAALARYEGWRIARAEAGGIPPTEKGD